MNSDVSNFIWSLGNPRYLPEKFQNFWNLIAIFWSSVGVGSEPDKQWKEVLTGFSIQTPTLTELQNIAIKFQKFWNFSGRFLGLPSDQIKFETSLFTFYLLKSKSTLSSVLCSNLENFWRQMLCIKPSGKFIKVDLRASNLHLKFQNCWS